MATYVTKQGDMWDGIAFAQLGNDKHADKLMDRNRKLIDYYIFPAGITLELPDIAPEPPDTLPPWMRMP